MSESSGVRRPFLYLAGAILALGALSLWLTWSAFPPQWSPEFACLLVAALVSENYAVGVGRYMFSLAYPLTMATLVLCGPTPALIVALSTSTNITDLREFDWAVTAYNAGQLLLCTSLAAWAYVSLGGRVLLASGGQPFTVADFPGILLPLAATAMVTSLGNIALASLGVSAKSGIPISAVLESVGWLPWGQFAFGIVGFVIAQVMAINIVAFAFFIFPLLVARQFYERFTSLQSAYTDTIRSLIGALEAKDPYTRGHSERVAEYAVLIARESGMESKEIGALENAALLHDLGKLALPGSLLRKQGKLDEAEWDAIRQHPVVGAEMVRRIPPLRHLAGAVEYHHERLDGSGYPHGSSGSELAQTTRIMAIADSYDAMTSDRPYRPGLDLDAAVCELRRCSGDKLDADLVEVLVASLPGGRGPTGSSLADPSGDRERVSYGE